jgi:hypothetical protein
MARASNIALNARLDQITKVTDYFARLLATPRMSAPLPTALKRRSNGNGARRAVKRTKR